MTYAGDCVLHDADSHLLEPPDWLARYADPRLRDRIPALDLHGLEREAAAALRERAARGDRPPDDDLARLLAQKNFSALGAFDPEDRVRALDLLGFRSQLVFSTYSHLDMIRLHGRPALDPDVLYGMVDAHNRGIVEFCAHDRRLLPVGFVALDDPERALAATRRALALGCAGVEVPSYPVGPRSLAHPEYDLLYAELAERGVPLLFHVGGGGPLVDPVYACNGHDAERLYTERETPIPTLTYIGIPAPLEMALAALIFDGVFERFPELRCGVIEQGASWVPGLSRRLDAALAEFGRPGQRARLSLRPSEYLRRQVRITPFAFEDIGWLVDQTGPELYLFGSDYPHDEGGTAPLERFQDALRGRPRATREAIYWRNFEDLMGDALPEPLRVRSAAARDPEDEVLQRTGEPLAVHRKKALLRLLVRDAAAALGLSAERHELQTAVDEFRVQNGLGELAAVLRWLDEAGLDEDALVGVLADGVLAEKLRAHFGERLERELPAQIGVASARRWSGRSRG